MKLRFLILFTVVCATAVQAQSFKPVLKLTTGKQYTITETSKGNISQEVMGQTMDIPMEVNTTFTLLVKNTTSNNSELSNTTSHLVLSMNAMGQDVKFDSDKKEDLEGDIGKNAAGMIGKETLFKVNNFGRVIEGSIIKPQGGAAGAASNPMMGMMNMGDGAQTSSAINLFVGDREIKVGDSYIDSSASADGKEKKQMTYTLVGIEKDSVKFAISGKTSLSKEIEAQGMQMTTNMNTQITGSMIVNPATGLLLKKILTSVIDGSVDVQGMSIPVTGTNTVVITVVEKQ
jgi:Family of unknown function (DUF6263)